MGQWNRVERWGVGSVSKGDQVPSRMIWGMGRGTGQPCWGWDILNLVHGKH